MSINIGKSLVSGTFWTAAGRYSNYGLQLVVTAILARLLDPSDFGVLGMIVVYTGFLNVLAEAGFISTIIQKRNLSETDLSSVFWFAGIVSVILVCFTLLISPSLENFFQFEGLADATRVTSFVFILVGLCAVPEGRLRRDLEFKKIAIIDMSTALLAGIFAIVLAMLGFGYWALIAQVLATYASKLILLLMLNGWLPSLNFDATVIRSVISFSGYVVGFGSINYWARNADNLLVGRVLGAAQLGFYSQAYKLMLLPQQALTGIIGPALHPVFSSIQEDLERMRAIYVKVLQLIIYISLPLSIFLSVMAPEVIRVVWGPRWEESIPVFRYLALVTGLQPAAATTGSALMGSNRPDLFFKMGVLSTLVYISGFAISINYGIVAVAQSYVITNLIVVPIVIYVTFRFALRGSPLVILKHVGETVFTIAAVIASGLIANTLLANSPDLIRLLLAGAISFLAVSIHLYLRFSSVYLNWRKIR